ncbi:FadR/GntR family transcriptional regulator [Nonomuraea sp. B10E15]|uniref:GntR family transcriptional regulator n=1 Tax=unclassified Nonomuraea TaxID=2593643 RepID=UPI00325F7875
MSPPRDRKGLPEGFDSSVFQSRRFADEVATIIRQLILSGQFEPGERLNELNLAETLSISRSPIREALQALAAEGLVRAVPGRGMFVAAFDAVAIDQLAEVRQALECKAARLAAERADDDLLDALGRLLASTKAALADPDHPYPRDLDFHQQVLDMSGNLKLVETARSVSRQFQLARARSGESPPRAKAAFEEHYRIYEAIRARDPEEADAAMHAHLEASRQNVRQLFEGMAGDLRDAGARRLNLGRQEGGPP